MNSNPVCPEDMLEDGADYKVVKGVRVRKGTIAAAINNIALLETADPLQQKVILEAIKKSAPALVVLGLHEYFSCRNKTVEEILVQTKKVLENEAK